MANNDHIPKQYDRHKDHIIAQHNRINQYLSFHHPPIPWFTISATIAAIKRFMAERQITEFQDAIRKFGYELSQSIIHKNHDEAKNLILGGNKKWQQKFKKPMLAAFADNAGNLTKCATSKTKKKPTKL
jgi:hypothetical protein